VLRTKEKDRCVGLRMLSLKYCRKVLGPDINLSDEDLVMLRDQLYCWANLALDLRQDSERKFRLATSNSLDQESLEERAAIIEFEANVSRGEAEKKAVELALENEHLN